MPFLTTQKFFTVCMTIGGAIMTANLWVGLAVVLLGILPHLHRVLKRSTLQTGERQVGMLMVLLVIANIALLPPKFTAIESSIRLSERYGGEWQGENEHPITIGLPGPLHGTAVLTLEEIYSSNRTYRLTPAIGHSTRGPSLVVQKLLFTMEQDGIEVDWSKSTSWEINGYPAPGLISFVTNIPMPIPAGPNAVSVTSPLAFTVKRRKNYCVAYTIMGNLDGGRGIEAVQGIFLIRLNDA